MRSIPGILTLLFVAACATSDQPVELSRAQYLMGTVCEITADKPQGMDAAFAEIARIESFLSSWRPESELSRINEAAPDEHVPASSELVSLLRAVREWNEKTSGAFNPLVRPLVDLWRTREEGAVPQRNAIEEALRLMRSDLLILDENSIGKRAAIRIEEGGFGKGYALDRAAEVLVHHRAKRAVMNFGGQVMIVGAEPVEVAIADPESRQRAAVTVIVTNGSVSTSSGSERTFEVGGRRFSHILDPRTGEALPPRGSATVIHPSALVADICSTALYVLGPEEGIAWANEHGISAIFLRPETGGSYSVILSDALRSSGVTVYIANSRFRQKDISQT